MHRSQLIKELKERFPGIAKDLNAERGLLAFELEVFWRHTQNCIDRADRPGAETCFEIARKYYVNGNAGMRDAIDTCFVELLDFRDSKKTSRAWAWECFPDVLKELHTRFHGRF